MTIKENLHGNDDVDKNLLMELLNKSSIFSTTKKKTFRIIILIMEKLYLPNVFLESFLHTKKPSIHEGSNNKKGKK